MLHETTIPEVSEVRNLLLFSFSFFFVSFIGLVGVQAVSLVATDSFILVGKHSIQRCAASFGDVNVSIDWP